MPSLSPSETCITFGGDCGLAQLVREEYSRTLAKPDS